ncbi:MAG: hypothetical protein DRP02_08875 [Candidatus Gerdarchaeota archaeon]|nr:MAG: hypothetical protein DRP02_08875 [Candidatus Gerdarchaeota archaeon]
MSYLFDELKGKKEGAPIEDKILLMGLQQAGKTAIKDVVFFGKDPELVENYIATIHYERQLIDKEKKSLITDADGQESYWNEAVTHFRHLIFSNVKLLLWVVDMTREDLFEESERRFSFTIRQFKKENPDGYIAVLCHKVDLISPEELVPLLERVKNEFSDPKFKIRFEATSIYYKDSLKELINQLMKEANLNTKRFELITNIGQKVKQSDEFQKYVVEHRDDPRIKQLMAFLTPKPQRVLPSFGERTIEIDLSEYKIIEIVLIDKATYSPITGISSYEVADVEQTMDYIIALQEFKDALKNKPTDDDSTISIVTSSSGKVHGMIVDLVSKFLLITSFYPITLEKTQIFYELIRKFAKSLDPSQKDKAPTKVSTKPKVEPPIATKTRKELVKISADKAKSSITSSAEITKSTIQPPIVEPEKVPGKDMAEITTEPLEIKTSPSLPSTESLDTPPLQISPPITTASNEEPTKKMEIEIKEKPLEEKSMFSFLNKLRTEELIEEGKLPEEEEEKEKLVKESSHPPPIVQKQQLIPEEPASNVQETKVEPIQEISIVVKEEEEVPHEEPKPKSRFLQRLREEEQRYLIRQVEIKKAKEKAEEKLEMTEEEVQEMADFLVKAQSSSGENK